MDFTGIPIIVVLCYLFIEAIKGSKIPGKWYPLISCGLGVLIALPLYFLAPAVMVADSLQVALLIGGISGLAATGSNQVFRQLLQKAKDGDLVVKVEDKVE